MVNHPIEVSSVGFTYGPVTVERCRDTKGAVFITLTTKKHSYKKERQIEIVVEKSGAVRIWSDEGQWKPVKR